MNNGMKKLVPGAALSGLALMIWGFLFWAIGPGHYGFSHLGAESELAVRTLLDREIPETGTYLLPDLEVGTEGEWATRHLEGPLAFLSVTKAGANPRSAATLFLGYLHAALASLLLGLVLRLSAMSERTYRERLQFAVMIGVLITFWANFSDPIWFYKPWSFQLVTSAYDIAAFAVMGSIMAKFVES